MKRLAHLLFGALVAFNLTACDKMTPKDPLPRHQALKAFDPHRKEFACTYEADAVPPIDRQAEAWHQEALYVTRASLWPNQRDWKKAEQLWTQAAERKHWKAMMNLASLYETGQGEGALAVPEDSYRAIDIVEEAMRLGIPAAYDKMGNYHSRGMPSIRPNGSRAWAFWERAADMGNPQALTHIGKALSGTYDNPEEGFWGNRAVALPMLECAVSQGFGEAAFVLGVTLEGTDASIGEDNARALQVLHEGVKFGSEKAAKYLFVSFDDGDQIVGNLKDPSRAARYRALGDALYRNRDLRFPNVDKVLPLPPTPLPVWDGQPQSLIDAAKAVEPVPVPKSTPGASRTGRAHIPEGHVLPDRPVPSREESPSRERPMAQYESTAARFTGYWLPRLLDPRTDYHAAWDRAQVPLRLARGEASPARPASPARAPVSGTPRPSPTTRRPVWSTNGGAKPSSNRARPCPMRAPGAWRARVGSRGNCWRRATGRRSGLHDGRAAGAHPSAAEREPRFPCLRARPRTTSVHIPT
jgi:TPR repeat protein